MGQTLSEPITAKETTSLKNASVMVASSSMQGWRVSMEDSHQHILELSPEDPQASYYAVFDGHGGSKVAKHSSIHLHRHIVNRPEYKSGNYSEAIREGFLECDRAMKETEELKNEMAGATAITVLMKENHLWCGNAGDSRCIGGMAGKAVPLSTDHKPNDPKEKERIEAAGGYVEFNRVNGNLALSRALGDFVFKKNDSLPQGQQIVSAEPEVEEVVITDEWDFLLLACDGIWDVLSNQQVCDFVTQRIGEDTQPELICEQLMDRCLAPDCQVGGLGCDNMTVVLVCFLHNKPWTSLVQRCATSFKARQAELNTQEGEEEISGESEELDTGPDSGVQPNVEQARDEE